MDTSAIRASNKSTRAALSAEQIASASVDINARIWRQAYMSRSKRIAAYFAVSGEIDCSFFIASAWQRGREIYLPVVRDRELTFAQYCAKTRLLRNRFGIPEPVCAASNYRKPSEMDVVLAPLVAFDEHGNRIGMGAGFYDRSFRFLQRRRNWQHPHLIGLAYEFQKTAEIKASSWDIPLHKVVTESRSYSFR